MRFFRSNTSLIGLDVGSRVVKIAQLQRLRQGWQSRAMAILPRRAEESPDQTAAQIALVLERQGFSGNRVVLAAPLRKLQCDMLDLPPRASGAPIEEIAKAEVARVTRLDPGHFEMGSWDIPAATRSSGTSMIALALRHEDADSIIDPLENHGLEVVAIDAPCWALHRACRKLSASKETCAILDLGWSAASLHIANRETILYQRTLWDAGMEVLHKAVIKQHGLDETAADLMLRAEDKEQCDLTTAGSLRPLTGPYSKLLCDELRTSLAFAAQRFAGISGNQLLLTGGGAALPGMSAFIKERLGLAVSIVTAGQLVELGTGANVESHLPLLATAVGLALYGQEEA